MTSSREIRLDRDAGPVVRPYALTAGRTQPAGAEVGLIDMVAAARPPGPGESWLGPEQHEILRLCRSPIAVAELASETDLPLGVVRVLVGDLCQQGLVRVVRAAGRGTPEESVLRSVLEGLRSL